MVSLHQAVSGGLMPLDQQWPTGQNNIESLAAANHGCAVWNRGRACNPIMAMVHKNQTVGLSINIIASRHGHEPKCLKKNPNCYIFLSEGGRIKPNLSGL